MLVSVAMGTYPAMKTKALRWLNSAHSNGACSIILCCTYTFSSCNCVCVCERDNPSSAALAVQQLSDLISAKRSEDTQLSLRLKRFPFLAVQEI